jgi:hypothetical protein
VTLQRASALDVLQAATQGGDALANAAAVDLKLRFSGAARADSATEA